MKKLLSLLALTMITVSSRAGNKILFYFNHPVDNSVSTGVNAVYLNHCVADTLVAYINRAHYSLDIAVYDYIQGSFASISTAINNAYSRGVQVRWIYDGSSSNSGLTLINSAINRVASPTSGSYGIMHNKFMVIDGNSSYPDDAIVWTGSCNWDDEQFNTDYNNIMILQDSALAHAYIAEFNMMWGGSGLAPNSSLAKFGPRKTDLGKHNFTIDGYHVELYFSPSDGTNSHIQSTINSANKDLYFAMYTFTDNTDASLIVSKYNSGVYVAGINDSYSNSYTPHSTFTSGLGSSHFIVYNGTGIYHNKYLIVDPSDKCSDPIILSGSHNWSISADTKNDENILIIHDDIAANIYYQSFKANFNAFGGTLSPVAGCAAATPAVSNNAEQAVIYPNPSDGSVTINYYQPADGAVKIDLYNVLGQHISTIADNDHAAQGMHAINCDIAASGVYFVCFNTGTEQFTRKIIITGR